jgi:hypothetical protein
MFHIMLLITGIRSSRSFFMFPLWAEINYPILSRSFPFTLERHWDQLCTNSEEQIYFVTFLRRSILEEKSERSMLGLSLLSHSCRFENWTTLKSIKEKIHELKIFNINEDWNKIDESCKMLCDERIIHLISRISDLKPNQAKNILFRRLFQIHFVDLNVPVKGWVTPVRIAINIQKLNDLEKTSIIALTRILGHELTYFMSQGSNNNFSISTQERVQSSSSLQELISELKVFYHHLENHIESGFYSSWAS